MKKKKTIKLPKMDGYNMDSVTTAFTERELTYVRKQVYKAPLRNLKAREILPISYDVPSFAKNHTYKVIERFGMMKLIQSYADNLPLATVGKKEVVAKVKAFGNAYEYSVDDVEASQAGKTNLPSEEAIAVRRAWEELLEKIAWLGDEEADIVGLFYNPNISVGSAITGDWTTATPKQIYDDCVGTLDMVFNATNGKEEADTLLVSANRWSKLKNTILYDNKTILSVLKENYENLTVDFVSELGDMNPAPSGGTAPVNCLFAFVNDISYLALEIPLEFKQMPPQPKNLAWLTNCYAKTAGMTVRYPLTMAIAEGI